MFLFLPTNKEDIHIPHESDRNYTFKKEDFTESVLLCVCVCEREREKREVPIPEIHLCLKGVYLKQRLYGEI